MIDHLATQGEPEQTDDQELQDDIALAAQIAATMAPEEVLGSHDEAKDGDQKTSPFAHPTTMSIVSHPFNLERLIRTKMSIETVGFLKKDLQEQGGQKSFLDHLLDSVDDSNNIGSYRAGIIMLHNFSASAIGGRLRMDEILQLTLNDALLEGAACSKCGKEKPKDPIKSHEVLQKR